MSTARSVTGGHPFADHEELARICRVLSIPVRLRILLLLARGERNVNALGDALRAPQPTVSHHLGLLRTSGIVEPRRVGKNVFYALRDGIAGDTGVTLNVGDYQVRFTIRPTSRSKG